MVLTECHVGGDSAFCLGGEQLWLGKVEHRGANTVKLLMYKPQRNAAGEPASLHLIKQDSPEDQKYALVGECCR